MPDVESAAELFDLWRGRRCEMPVPINQTEAAYRRGYAHAVEAVLRLLECGGNAEAVRGYAAEVTAWRESVQADRGALVLPPEVSVKEVV